MRPRPNGYAGKQGRRARVRYETPRAFERALSDRLKRQATKDVDLDMLPPPAEDLLNELQEAAEKDLGEFFEFRLGVPKPMRGAPLGSLRFSVEARLTSKPFTGFALDVGQGKSR